MPVRVLLFIEHFGDGHSQVAKALRAEFERRSAVVEEVDCMRSAHPRVARMNEAVFDWLTRYTPFIYGWSYEGTRRLSNRSWLWRAMSRELRDAAQRAVGRFSPDVVLQLFPDHTLMSLDRLQKRPLAGVVLTDFSVHGRWFVPGADVYYLPHDSFLSEARQRAGRAEGASFVCSGIPLRPQFATVPANDERHSAANARGHIVVATGGRGVFGALSRVLDTLYEHRDGRDVVVFCGRNADMLRAVEELSSSRPGLIPLPFVEDVSSWFRGAAYAVTKPGGVTIAECLASGCPMIFYRPSPGQELDNARFVKRVGAGDIVANEGELAQAAIALGQTHAGPAASLMARFVSHPDAARRVVDDVFARLEQRGALLAQRTAYVDTAWVAGSRTPKL